MHIGGGLSRMRTGVRTIHLAEILAATGSDTRVHDIDDGEIDNCEIDNCDAERVGR
jgi:hypothetical protein